MYELKKAIEEVLKLDRDKSEDTVVYICAVDSDPIEHLRAVYESVKGKL